LDHRNKQGYDILLFRAPTSQGKKQSPYMEGTGTNLSTITHQEDPTLESYNPIYTTLMETASLQKVNQSKNHQMKNQQHCDQHQRKLVIKSLHSGSHLQLSKQLCSQQHQEPSTHMAEQNPQDYRQQTHTALALLLFARNNGKSQQIWQLQLLQLQQQQLLFDLEHRQPPPPQRRPHHPKELPTIYELPCKEHQEDLGDPQALEGLEGLVDLEQLWQPQLFSRGKPTYSKP
jgi:hypothetical protein